MRDEAVGVLGGHGLHEMAPTNSQNAIDEVLEFAGSRQGKMALENDPVEAMKSADDEAGELDQEDPYRAHGILPRVVA